MERGLEGGQRPHNRPLSPARRAQGESHEKKERKRENAGCSRKEQGSGESPTPVEVGGERLGFSALFQSFCSYPLRPPGGASEGPVVGNLRFPPRGPSLQAPPESPFPFRVERLPVRPVSSCSNKSFAFGTLGLIGTGSHGGATKLNASFSPFPPYGPAKGLGVLRSCPPPRNPSDGGTGDARRVIPLS